VYLGLALGLTDAADGFLARLLHAQSKLGARLDSFADLAGWVCGAAATIILVPGIVRAESPSFVVLLISFVAPLLYSAIKYGRIASYHTRLAQWAAVSLWAAMLLLVATGAAWPTRCAAVIVALSALEELVITYRSAEPRTDVRSFLAMRPGGAVPNDATGSDFGRSN
jgi:CDP-diacylglycerol--glycerol-3-phosphate 3-phosphatidyltransferase